MDQITLVENRIDDGTKLIEELEKAGIPVTAACWIKTDDDEQWYLYVASPIVDDQGPVAAYRRVHSIIRQMPGGFWIDPFEVRLLGANDPVAQAVLESDEKHPARIATRYKRPTLGGISIEAAYIYPPK